MVLSKLYFCLQIEHEAQSPSYSARRSMSAWTMKFRPHVTLIEALIVRVAMPAEVHFEVVGEILENLVKIWGKTSPPAKWCIRHLRGKFQGKLRRKFSETLFQFSREMGDVKILRPRHESPAHMKDLSGTGGSQRDSRESIRANHSQLKPLFLQHVRLIRMNHSNF